MSSEEFNDLENHSTNLCTFVQDESSSINIQIISQIEINTHIANDGNNRLIDNPLEHIPLEIITHYINNVDNNEKIIDSGFLSDIYSNFLNQREEMKDKDKEPKDNLLEDTPTKKDKFHPSKKK